MFERVKLVSGTCRVMRPVSVSVVAIAVVACAMAIKGWHLTSLALGGLLAFIAGVLVFQVYLAVRHLNDQSSRARRAARKAEEHYVDVLRRIVRFAEDREQYACGHSQNVARLTEAIARKLGLPPAKCTLLSLAGQLHDIGLLAVPERILTSHLRIGDDAFDTLRKHTQVSYELLEPLEMLKEVLPAICCHHERMNGTGYPAGISGDEIPLDARILAVADTYDAMTHDRPHRPAISPFAAVSELRRCCPAGYDQACVEALAEVVSVPLLEEAAGPTPAPAPATI